jgi:hypothetical protein
VGDSSGSATGVCCAAVRTKICHVTALIAGSLFLGLPLWVPLASAGLLTWFLVERTVRERQKLTERRRLRKQFWRYEERARAI